MPLNRSYGGYSNSYGSSSYSNYSSFPKYSSGYASTYGLRSGSSSPALVRSSTPSYREPYSYNNSIINSVVPEEKKVDTRPSTGYTRYTTDYYSPYSRSYLYTSEAEKRELKTIKTEEIDTTDARKTGRDYAIPGEITRDTTVNLPRGKAVVRMVTQKLKENPYLSTLILDKENDPKKLTLGQRLALKYQIKEKPKPKPPTPPKPDSGEESEWTWESYSSSDEESTVPKSSSKKDSPVSKKESPPVSEKKPPVKKKSPTPPKYVSSVLAQARAITQKYTRSNTTTICSAEEPSAPKPEGRSSANKWLEALNADTKPRTQQNTTRIPNFGKAVAMNRSLLGNKLQEEQSKVESPTLQVRSSNSRPLSWAGNQYSLDTKPEENNNYSRDIRSVSRDTSSTSKEPLGSSNKSTSYSSYSKEPVSYSRYSSIPREPASYITTESMSKVKKSPKKESDSSSTSSSSPPLYKYRKPQRYTGAGSQYMYSSDEESPRDSLNLGWRKGQPPRGDVVVKLGNNKNKSVIEPVHSKSTLGRSSYTSISTSASASTEAASTVAASTVAVDSAAAATVSSAISSRVPASMQERYQIPGLFIKPSTKTQPKSVKPVASKSEVSLPVSKTAPTKEVSDEESEWEYYTETETSDSDKNDEETKNIKTKVDTASSLLDKKAGLNSSQAGSIELPDSKLPAYKAPPVKVNLEITPVPVHQKQNITFSSIPEKIQEKVEKIYISPKSTKPGIDKPKDSNQHSDLETQVKPDENTKSTANSSRLILDVKETGLNRDIKISEPKITKPLSSAPTVENDHELNQTKINSLSSSAKPHTREQDAKVHSISVDPMKKILDQGSINLSTSKTKEKTPDKQTINVTSTKAKDKLIPQSSEQENLGAISKKAEHKVVEKKTDKVSNSKDIVKTTPNLLENEPPSIISAKPKEKNTSKTGSKETNKVAKTKAEEKVPEKSNDKEFSKNTSAEKKEPTKAKKLVKEPINVFPNNNLYQEHSNITIKNSEEKLPVKSELDLLDIYKSKAKKQIPVKTETKGPEINTESKLVKKVKTKAEPVFSKQVVDVKEDIIKPEAVTPSDAPKQQEKVKRNAVDLKGVTAKPDFYLLEPKSGPGESRRTGQDMLSEGSDSCRTSTTASRELSPTNGFMPTTSLERLPPSLSNLFSQTPTQGCSTQLQTLN